MIALTFVLSGALCAALSLPLIQGRVKRNRWYGVRIPQALESDIRWYAINRFGGWQLLGYSAALTLLGSVLFFVPVSPEHWFFWLTLLAPGLLLVPMVWRIVAYANRPDQPEYDQEP